MSRITTLVHSDNLQHGENGIFVLGPQMLGEARDTPIPSMAFDFAIESRGSLPILTGGHRRYRICNAWDFPMTIDATVGVERHWREDDDEGHTLEEANWIEKCKGVLRPAPVGIRILLNRTGHG
jgi:hypothetical protein